MSGLWFISSPSCSRDNQKTTQTNKEKTLPNFLDSLSLKLQKDSETEQTIVHAVHTFLLPEVCGQVASSL